MLGCTRFFVGTWNPPLLPKSVGWHCHILLPDHTSASSLPHLLPQRGDYWGLWREGKCQPQDPAFCMQNQEGKGGKGLVTACGERTVSLHINCILHPRSSSLHCLRYDSRERYFNIRSSLSNGKKPGVLVPDVSKSTDRCVSWECALNV